jgi:peptide/nickel transport system substrate-binding protein
LVNVLLGLTPDSRHDDVHRTRRRAAWNDTHWKNPRFNRLLVARAPKRTKPKRAAMYAECQQLVHDDGGQMVLMFYNFVGALSTAVAHGEQFRSEGDGGYMFERWWMA